MDNKLDFTINLRDALKAIKDKSWAINFKIVSPENQTHLQLDSKLETYWETLFASLPRIEPWLLDPISLNQKVTLTQWVNGLAAFFKGEIFGRPYNFFLPSSPMETVLIWGRFDKWYLSDEVSDYRGDTYWYRVFRNLETWRFLTKAILEEVVWKVDSQNQVDLKLSWIGPFKSFEKLGIKGSGGRFWKVSLTDGLVVEHDLANATSSLLTAQLLIQHGHNYFIPINLDGNRLTTSLKILRADFERIQEPISIPAETILQQIVDFIIALARPGYLQASMRLEAELSQEIKRLQEIAGEGQKLAINRLQQDVLGQIVSVRKTFFGDTL